MGILGSQVKKKLKKEVKKLEEREDVNDDVKAKAGEIREELDAENVDNQKLLQLADEMDELTSEASS